MYLTPYYTEHTAKSQHEQLLSTVPCDWGLGLLCSAYRSAVPGQLARVRKIRLHNMNHGWHIVSAPSPNLNICGRKGLKGDRGTAFSEN